ncbi:MAG: hypothetical protein ACRCZZ_07430, partial [Phocaeicola sp.]
HTIRTANGSFFFYPMRCREAKEMEKKKAVGEVWGDIRLEPIKDWQNEAIWSRLKVARVKESIYLCRIH